jgi:hypothetical protein
VRIRDILIGFFVISNFIACGVSEGDFIAGADHDPCRINIPVCNQTAGCALGEWNYTEGDFPGFTNFIVTTPADTWIVVKLFFKDFKHPGDELEIVWYEPGCRDKYVYNLYNKDVYEMAGGDRVFAQEKKVRQAGDHLIEIYSDATTHFFVRVELKTPM